MSRLIDAEELMRDIDEIYDTDKHKWSEDAEDILKEISEARTVDAEPIRHGHWIEEEDTLFRLCVYKCSLCGGEVLSEAYLFKYCPYCGCAIKMEVEEDE